MRNIFNLNANWVFAKDVAQAPAAMPADWEAVTLPHSWNAVDGQDGGGDYFRGKCCYAKTLAKAFRSIDKLASASLDELLQVDEIGARIAQSIMAYFANEKNQELIERLRQAGVQMEMEEADMSDYTDKLAGKSIVISGVFAHHSRDEYKEIIEKNGGKNVGSISKKTSFILAGENMGPAKLEKAEKLGVPIVNEEEFLKLLE